MTDYSRTDGAITASALKAGTVSMLHMRHAMTGGKKADTPAMRWGRLVHGCVLEPTRYLSEDCAVWTGERKAGLEWAQFANEAGTREVVTLTELGQLQTISAAVHGNRDAHDLLTSTEHEQTREWTGAIYGRAKCRMDGYAAAVGIVELKTSGAVDPRRFGSQAAKLGYDLQLAWYCQSTKHLLSTPCYIIAVESKPPHDVAVYKLAHDTLAIAAERAVKLAEQYRACEASGVFPGVSAGVQELTMPDWATGGDIDDGEE